MSLNHKFAFLRQLSGQKATDKKLSRPGIGVVVLVVCFACVVVVLWRPRVASKKTKTNVYFSQQLSPQMLEKNMMQLSKKMHHVQKEVTKTANQTHALTHSQAYLDRMHQSSQLFTGTVQNPVAPASQSPGKAALLRDGTQQAAFANHAAGQHVVSAVPASHANQTVMTGTFIDATLNTAINSDLPGMVEAVVSLPVYAYTGHNVLVPAGSRLMGQYSSAVLQGQSRVMVIWDRLVLPSGVSVLLNSPSTDVLGRSGQHGHVNRHFLQRFGEATLLSLIGASTASFGVGGATQPNSLDNYRSSVASAFSESAAHSVQSRGSIKPTLSMHQGARIHVFVAHDLDFSKLLVS